MNGDSGVESADDKKENSSDKKDGEEKAAPDAKKKKSPKNKETKAAEPAQNGDGIINICFSFEEASTSMK